MCCSIVVKYAEVFVFFKASLLLATTNMSYDTATLLIKNLLLTLVIATLHICYYLLLQVKLVISKVNCEKSVRSNVIISNVISI